MIIMCQIETRTPNAPINTFDLVTPLVPDMFPEPLCNLPVGGRGLELDDLGEEGMGCMQYFDGTECVRW